MKSRVALLELGLFLTVLALVNGSSLAEVLVFRNPDASLIASAKEEDEARYIGKIREAAEGRWLMANPFLKEHRDDGFSPSGFMEWIPAASLRLMNGNLGLMLFLTDLLAVAVSIVIVRLWLGRILRSRLLIWCCILFLMTTFMGGELQGLLRDTAPKFTWAFFGLWLFLLTSPSRSSIKQMLLRGVLVGVMFYTYPYHWTLALITEGLFLMSDTWAKLRHTSWKSTLQKFALPRAAAAFVPFLLLASPLVLAMREMTSRPEFSDFYSRYHIVYTHLPAAPSLQITILLVLAVSALVLWFQKKNTSALWSDFLPLLLPIIAMLVLLNSTVLTGKDPELLGHGRRVILPIIFVAYVFILSRTIPARFLHYVSIVALCLGIGVGSVRAAESWKQAHAISTAWEASPEKKVLTWLQNALPPEQIIAAPRILSERIPVYTSHYVYFGAGAHFFFVSTDELADRYIGWVGLYPWERELSDPAVQIIFGNHPGAQWSKERTWYEMFHEDPFPKTMADYIPRQDLRHSINAELDSRSAAATVERMRRYNTDVLVLRTDQEKPAGLTQGFALGTRIEPYEVWVRRETE